jgi:hypothetical protein
MWNRPAPAFSVSGTRVALSSIPSKTPSTAVHIHTGRVSAIAASRTICSASASSNVTMRMHRCPARSIASS